jgi:hypothetical protein
VELLDNGWCRPLLCRYDPHRRGAQEICFYRKPSRVLLVYRKDRNQLNLLDREVAGGFRDDNGTPLRHALDLQFVGEKQIRFVAAIGFGRRCDAMVRWTSRMFVDPHGPAAISANGQDRALSCSLHAYHMLM